MNIHSAVMITAAGLLIPLAHTGYSASNRLMVTDALDRVVGFAQPPQRIAVAGKASFMVANAACLFPQARQRILPFFAGGISRQGAGDFLSQWILNQKATAPFDGNASVEQIASTHPDVVLLKSASRRLGDTLDRIGIPVVYLDFETPVQYERDLTVFGQLLDAPARAKELISYYQKIQEAVQNRTETLRAADKPRVLLIQYSERAGVIAFSVPSRGWIQTEMVERAGGIPVWKDAAQQGGWTIVNLEQIAAWHPDKVLVVNYPAGANQAVADLVADAKWKILRAIQENRIYAFPGDFCSWDQPDPRWGLGLLWTATRLHPQLFQDIDLPGEIARFYALYDLDPVAVQSNVLPLIRENIDHVSE